MEGLSQSSTCSGCEADLHTCTNCMHFDTSEPNECRLEIEHPIAKKSLRNECDQFEPKLTLESGSEKGGVRDARSEFDSLFNF